MLKIRLARDDVAQQALHLIGVAGFFGKQGCVVSQFYIFGSLLLHLALQRIGLLAKTCITQQLYLGHLFEASLVRPGGGHGADQLLRLPNLALARQKIGATGLHAQQIGSVGDFLQIGISILVALLLFCQVGLQQVKLCLSSIASHAFRHLGYQDFKLRNRCLSCIEFVVLKLQAAQNSPAFGEFRRCFGEGLELGFGIRIALLSQQHAGIGQAHLWRRILLQILLHQWLNFGGA